MSTWRRDPSLASLFDAPPSDARPFLMELAAAHAARRRPADLLAQMDRDGFVRPSAVDQRLAHRIDGLALDAASEFEAVLLSPVAPLGTCSVVAPTSQDRVLSTTRATEVVSDPTNVLALEAARRLRADAACVVRLCTVHQVVRAQPHPKLPGFAPHFRLFAMVEAGRARAEDGFEASAFVRHLAVYDRLFDAASSIGASLPRRRATVYRAAGREVMAERVARAVSEALPHVALAFEPLESRYYAGLRVLFGGDTPGGEHFPIVDVGVFDWMAALTGDRRQRMVASGCGVQLLALRFR